MRQYIYTRLGQPVINVELAPIQVDIAINDTIQDMNRYNYGDGAELTYTTLLVAPGVSEYYTGDSGIEAAFDIQLSTGMDGINTLFSPTHMLLYNDWVTNGNYPGGSGYSIGGSSGGTPGGSGLILSGYEIAMEYLEQAKQMFGKMYRVHYSVGKQALIVTPTPETCMIASLALYCRTSAEKLYNHPLVKKLAVARAKIQWGLQIGKFSVTLPDGTTMNGFEIMNRGYEEEEKAFENLKSESQPCDFFIG
jgi:hypothetical protein